VHISTLGRGSLATALLLALGCQPTADSRDGESPPAAAEPEAPFNDPALADVSALPLFHRGIRRMDLAGAAEPDSVVLSAYGVPGDSLVVRMEFFVDGQGAFRRSWWSASELIDRDSVRADPELLSSYLVSKFDRELSSVTREPIDPEAIRTKSFEPELIAQIQPPPQSQVTFGYGSESTVTLVFDPSAQRFVVSWECCRARP
jgi:hypothetical protein